MKQNKKHWHLYVLNLAPDKYYVGITSKTVEHRFIQHKNGIYGAAWTRKYKPISIIDSRDLGYVTEDEAKYYENIVVRKYIHKYGIKNVRGGDITETKDLFIFRKIIYEKKSLIDMFLNMLIGAILAIAIVYLFNELAF